MDYQYMPAAQHHLAQLYTADPRSHGFLTPQAIGNGVSAQDYFHYQVVDRPQSAGPHMGVNQHMLYSQAGPTPTQSPRPHMQRQLSHPFVLRLAPQHFVPSTPSLSTSRSSLSSQSVESPALIPAAEVDYFGHKHNCSHEDVHLLGSTHSPPMSPAYHAHQHTADSAYLLTAAACPSSITPTPSPIPRSVLSSADVCDPRNLVASSFDSEVPAVNEFAASAMPPFEPLFELDDSSFAMDQHRRHASDSTIAFFGEPSFSDEDQSPGPLLSPGSEYSPYGDHSSFDMTHRTPVKTYVGHFHKTSLQGEPLHTLPSSSPVHSSPCHGHQASGARRGRKQSLTDDPSKTFVCTLCSRKFRRQEHLKRHYRSLHTHEKPFKCGNCSKKFSRSDNLSQHQRTHGITTGVIMSVPSTIAE